MRCVRKVVNALDKKKCKTRTATAEGSNMDIANTHRGDTAELGKIRTTDNTLKEGDKPGIYQEPKPLVLGENGLPVDWNGGE